MAIYPFKKSFLLSLDGGGDNLNWSFYSLRNETLKLLEDSATYYKNKKLIVHDTPADVYANTTKFLGFRRMRDEGKLMGLAASGKPKYIDYFNELLYFKNGRFVSKLGSQNRNKIQKIRYLIKLLFTGVVYDNLQINDMKKNLKKPLLKEDIACSLQRWVEKITMDFLDYLSKKYKFKKEKILLSGGFFSNVLVNQIIRKRKDIENVYVTPNMGDGGLVLGAIYLILSKLKSKKYFNKISKNVFYGTNPKISYLSKNEYEKLKFTPKKLYDYISNYLIEDKIVGVINNRMEFGPRALGNDLY